MTRAARGKLRPSAREKSGLGSIPLMMKPELKLFGLGLVGAAILSAANFWETEDYTEWSAKEVHRILNNSPWAKKVALSFGGMGGPGGQGSRGGYGGGYSRSRR